MAGVRFASAVVLGLACCALSLRAQGPADELERGFKNPPDAAKIAVTNQWTNRLLGDRLEPAERKVLGSSGVNPGGIGAGPNPAAPESGLLGPVRLLSSIPTP